MEGKCGICGDPYDGPWEHQAPGGMFANGNIVGEYQQVKLLGRTKVLLHLTKNYGK